MNDNNSHTEEISIYFEDILRNKDMIKEMFKTNILVYEDKIKINQEKILKLKEELEKITSEFSIVENKLKLTYAKTHDQFQKHDINFKLLDKTHIHYKMLIKEREDEIKKIEEQTIFAYQDYQNKKIKLDCMNVQIVEAEFQLKNLQQKFDEQVDKVIENPEDYNSSFLKSNLTNLTSTSFKKENQLENLNRGKIIQEKIEKMEYKSEYIKNNSQKNTDDKDSIVFDQIAMANDNFRKNKCIIY